MKSEAYLANLPWSAANGDELGCGEHGFARKLLYVSSGTGVKYHPPDVAVPQKAAGHGGMKGAAKRAIRHPYNGRATLPIPERVTASDKALRKTFGKYTLLTGTYRAADGALVVKVKCECGSEREMDRNRWENNERTPKSCLPCARRERGAGLRNVNQLGVFAWRDGGLGR